MGGHRAGAKPSVLPGFGLSLGLTLFYSRPIVLIPLAALVLPAVVAGLDADSGRWSREPRVLAALRLSFRRARRLPRRSMACSASSSPGRWCATASPERLIDALVDLPFALPTAVAGIALATLYAPNGWLGALLAPLGIKTAYTPLGVVLALTFIGLPFVVRTRAAGSGRARRGSGRGRRHAGRLAAADLLPRDPAGALRRRWSPARRWLSRARVGEYGSVIFIAGNLPMVSEIAPLLIVIKLEQYDYAGAAAIGVVMLASSFAMHPGAQSAPGLRLRARR